ncbi:hypothetical protein Agabi119p4_2035 [Agaricus bisporus var. burnettii]|uniref:Uncharacterized protein n=1 Tax=Agaricus bisporus var. burnettii TaxID=192524 RepID=A0A8H7F8F3_AGABI|nr:hypothetical protein Agabi119p4_2035 [Agaricus bisporus var. burnettii]
MQTAPRRITPYSPFAPSRGERRNYLSSTQYSTAVPNRTQISPGVWSDGGDRVYSAALPAVQLLLAEARATLKEPTASNEIIFALAALDVFYKPGDPAHWIFWSDEKKLQTAEVVTRIALHQPPLIRTPVAWNGTSEYLYILANHHGSSHRQAYESQPWFHKLVPQKTSTAPKVPNLRKRRQNPGAFREPSKSPGPDDDDTIDEPPRKKPKSKLTTSPEPPADIVKPSSHVSESSSANKPQKSSIAPSLASNSHATSSQQSEPDITHAEEAIQTRMSTRNRKGGSSQTASTSSRASSLSPADNSTASHSRNRSISHVSSQTAVASSSSRRSASVLSAATIVDGSSSSKGKQHEDPKDTSDAQSDEEGMVTRGRASRARVDTLKTTPEVISDRMKSSKPGPNAARTASQKVKRKP